MSDQNTPKDFPAWLIILFQTGIVILSIAIGYFGRGLITRYHGDLSLLNEARDILLENIIHEVPPDPALEYGMIRGMLAVMDDPYTHFVEPAVHEIRTNELTGRFGGVGVRLERDTRANWRLYPLPDSPALAAGIQDGDLLLAVDNLSITNETEELDLVTAIRGPEGENAKLTILRNGQERTFEIMRQWMPLPSITWHLMPEDPQIGVIRVNRIADTTADEMQAGIESLVDLGAEALIVDLRDNGGGLVDAGVEIARLFLESGEIINQTFKGETVKTINVDQPGPFIDQPLVLLINGNTASSAEIVAGALAAHQRATLVGTPTFGKTSIQFIFELGDGSSVNITSGRWWVPGQDFPLEPDIMLMDDPTGVLLLQTAIEVLNTPNQP
jgi:carboxyl-terminal processing protease